MPRVNLTTKFLVLIGLVAALAVVNGLIAVYSSWRMGQLLQGTLDETLPSLLAAEELEISLMEQSGHVASYLLDGGNRQWLEDLAPQKQNFDHWLARAKHTSRTPEQNAILARLESVFGEYYAKRSQVLALHDAGQRERSTTLLLDEVNPLYREAFKLCEQFIAANQHFLNQRAAEVQQQVGWMTWFVGVSAGLTVVMAVLLVWMFMTGVLIPLRGVVAELRTVAEFPGSNGPPPSHDELESVGVYLRALMSDVMQTRHTLDQSQDRLAAAEKLATVGKLAASVAHEIRNPLTAIKMWLFSLQKDAGGEPETDRKFQFIGEEISRLESIVRNFLEFARPPRLRLGPHRPDALVSKTLELLRPRMESKRITALWEVCGDLPSAMIDAEQFRQVLVNLLDNAAEVTPPGGQICVTAAAAPGPEGQPAVVLRIADRGPGMSEEVQARVFEPFYTTKEDGMGLGLCIAARIMAQHGGRLTLESTGPSGTTFALWLPAAHGESTA